MRIKLLCGLAVVMTAALTMSAAQASLLSGKTLGYELLLGDTTDSDAPIVLDETTFAVGSGVEVQNLTPTIPPPGAANDDDVSIDVSDTHLTFIFHLDEPDGSSDTLPGDLATDFIGFRLFDVNGTISPFTSLAVNSSLTTTPASFDPSRLSFDANNIYFNGAGYTVFDGKQLVFNIQSNQSQAVPAPSSLVLFLFGGLALVGGAIFRRRHSGAAPA